MAVYDIDGTELTALRDNKSVNIRRAYDIDGNPVFAKMLKVASYNVGGWYDGTGTNVPDAKANAYLKMQNDTLENVNADIICLEEFWTYFSGTTKAYNAILSNFYPYYHSANGSNQYFGRCICSKFPMSDYAQHSFANEANRYYDEVTVDVNGVQIHVFVTHLSGSSDRQVRIDQAKEIHDYIAAQGYERYIVFGDFNVSMVSPMSDYNVDVFGSFLEDGCELANGGTFGVLETYSRNSIYDDNLAVDNIIISDAFTAQSTGIDLTKVTFQATNGDKIDHIPLIADISI